MMKERDMSILIDIEDEQRATQQVYHVSHPSIHRSIHTMP